MRSPDLPSVVIKLSPTQVDEVVRAASQSRAPSISSLVADALRAPARDGKGGPFAGTRLAGFMPIDTADPRLSRSLLRGLSLLTCFGPDNDARGIVEISEELGMSASTTHRYAVTLVELGLLERSPKTRKYRLAHGPGE